MVKDRVGNIYEGFAAVRDLNTKTQMTTESVFSLFSTTKAITGAALMKLHD
nr:beta-lactamase family protein [Ureibacillus acetophenoni]